MRILVAGSDKIFAIENIYVKYLRQAGHEVYHFSSRSIFFDYYHGNLFNKLVFQLGISNIYRQINKRFKTAVEGFNPNVIWIFKGMEIFPETLRWAKQRGIKLVNYNADNPFIFSGRGSGNRHLTDSLELYDLHFSYNPSVIEIFKNKNNIKTSLLPFGFDIDEDVFQRCLLQKEILCACFLGNPDRNRADFIKQLADRGIRISVYGKDWPRFIRHSLVEVHGSVHAEELWKVLRKYRVQLNLLRIHNEDSHNMRTFEVPAIGGIMVAPDTTDHRLYFEDGKEVILFKDLPDCVEKITHVLNLSNDEADKIRNAARDRSILSHYSYKYRSHYVIQELSEL